MRWVGPIVFFVLWTAVGLAGALDYRGFARWMYKPGKDFWGEAYTPLSFIRGLMALAALVGFVLLGLLFAAMV